MLIQDNKNKSLKNSKIFSNKNISSMPSSVFIALLALTSFVFLLTIYYVGIIIAAIITVIFGFVVFVPAFLVHKNDHQGYITWLTVLFSANELDSNSFQQKNLKIVSFDDDETSYMSLINYRKRGYK